MARAAGSLLARHSYPSVCAMVFPHVVGDMLSQRDSFSADAEVSEAIERGKVLPKTLVAAPVPFRESTLILTKREIVISKESILSVSRVLFVIHAAFGPLPGSIEFLDATPQMPERVVPPFVQVSVETTTVSAAP